MGIFFFLPRKRAEKGRLNPLKKITIDATRGGKKKPH